MFYPMSNARRKQKISNSPYSSPHRPRRKEKTSTVIYEGNTALRDSLQARLDAMLRPAPVSDLPDSNTGDPWMDIDENDNLVDENIQEVPPAEPDHEEPLQEPSPSKDDTTKSRRILPSTADYRLYNEWMKIIPTLVDDYIQYANATMGERIGPTPEEIYRQGCKCHDEKLKATTLTCLYGDCE